MRILLDECVSLRLSRELADHEVRSVPEMGWASQENGELLALASGKFDVFVTTDQRLSYQQAVSSFAIAVSAKSSNDPAFCDPAFGSLSLDSRLRGND